MGIRETVYTLILCDATAKCYEYTMSFFEKKSKKKSKTRCS